MRAVIWSVLVLGTMLGLSSCASRADSWRRAETEKITRGEFLLSATNAQLGESYEVLVYVVASGDTLSSISRRFGCTVKDLKTLNPDLAASSSATQGRTEAQSPRGQKGIMMTAPPPSIRPLHRMTAACHRSAIREPQRDRHPSPERRYEDPHPVHLCCDPGVAGRGGRILWPDVSDGARGGVFLRSDTTFTLGFLSLPRVSSGSWLFLPAGSGLLGRG